MNQDIIIKKTDESNAYLVYYESEKIKYDVSVSGDIRLKSCDGQNLELKTSDGSVTGSLKTTKSFDAKASSGDVNLPANGNGGNCIIRTESGDIDISIED